MLEKLILGPMFAGKTTQLLEIADKLDCAWEYFRLTTEPCVICDEVFHTHDERTFIGKKVSSLSMIESDSKRWDAVLVDEIQFADPQDVPSFLDRLEGKRIFAAGLDMDFRRMDFEATKVFQNHAQQTSVLRARCSMCGHNTAEFSKKVSGDTKKRLDEDAKYIPLCRICWQKSESLYLMT
jgi:thymidine kinase